MRVAFVLIPEKGHINPYIGPAQAFTDDGHDVIVAAPANIADQLDRAGLVFRDDLLACTGDDRPTHGADLVELIQDAPRLAQWIEQLLLTRIPEQTAVIADWLARERVDAVVIDPLYYPAAIAAHLTNVSWASVSNSLNPAIPSHMDSALLRTVRALAPRRADVFAAYSMRPSFAGCDVLSPFLNVAFTTRALAGDPPPSVEFVGPSFPLRARGDEVPFRPLPAGRPVVYASFGSQIYFWPEIFEKLAAASESIGAHLVLSIGGLIDDPRWTQPRPHCDAYRYAPQLAILPQAAAFVTHGGANSVMEAIACGVPMLVSPMCNDQFHQAWFVEAAGIGLVEDLIHAPVETVAAKLRQLLDDTSIRDKMKAVSATYQVNGARSAAKLIARLGKAAAA